MNSKKRVRTYLAASLLALSLISTAGARIITVDDDAPADFNDIQAAIIDANNGDTVEIQPGTYTGNGNRDIDFLGKAITVRSKDPNNPNIVAATIIDCYEGGRFPDKHLGFAFKSAESEASILAGLTIVNGRGRLEEFENPPFGTQSRTVGGAIYCDGSSPIIRQCVISNNATYTDFNFLKPDGGGGIFIKGGNPIITGCTIEGNSAEFRGGGICSIGGNPTIINCTISDNQVYGSGFGGGIYSSGGTLTITDSKIYNNQAFYGERGGGIYLSSGIISNCEIKGNLVLGDSLWAQGGGIYANGGNILIEDCTITNNYVKGCGSGRPGTGHYYNSGGNANGGGIFASCSEDYPIEIRNCILSGNTACGGYGGVYETSTSVGPGKNGGHGFGGAIYGSEGSIIISNCTIADNASQGGDGGRVECVLWKDCDRTPGFPGMSYGGAICLRTTEGIISNSILSNNTARFGDEVAALPGVDPTEVTMTFSDVEAGQAAIYTEEGASFDWGRGNIVADPCFVALGQREDSGTIFPWNNEWIDGDYHLKSEKGRWDPNIETWVLDDVTSPCIDTGDPNSKIGLEPLPNGGILNMGAYGGSPQASMSPYDTNNIADRDFDGFIYRTDLLFFMKQWLANRALLPADFIADNIVNFPDFAAFAQKWQCPPLPLAANTPFPNDGEICVEASPTLTWAYDPHARVSDVYLGTTSPGTFQGRQYTNTFEPGALEPNTLYYWHVDQIGLAGQVPGPIWTFKTGVSAVCINPQDGEGQVPISNVYLAWASDPEVLSHDVYFGITNPPEFRINQSTTIFWPGSLEIETTYYWRIDERYNTGLITGSVWTFTTGNPSKTRCFPADTIVWADGEMVEISKVSAGAMVDKSADVPMITELHKTVCTHQIEGIDVHNESDSWDRYDIVFENGNTLAVADSHYFLLNSGRWASLQKLTTGSKLSTLEGSVTIKTIKKTTSAGTVYNLRIKDSDRYLVGKDGIIVRDW